MTLDDQSPTNPTGEPGPGDQHDQRELREQLEAARRELAELDRISRAHLQEHRRQLEADAGQRACPECGSAPGAPCLDRRVRRTRTNQPPAVRTHRGRIDRDLEAQLAAERAAAGRGPLFKHLRSRIRQLEQVLSETEDTSISAGTGTDAHP